MPIARTEILTDLLKSLEQGGPVPQRSRVRLIFGLKDYLCAENADLAVCLGVKGTRNRRLIRNHALRRMRDILNDPNTERLCQGIHGLVEQAGLKPESPDEPELIRLARTVRQCGAKLPGKRQLREILELK